MSAVALTESQRRAVDAATNAVHIGAALFRVGGFAGVGKTTIIRPIRAALHPLIGVVCAYTGKAASVLRGKGILDAATIHSTVMFYDEETGQFFRRAPSDVVGDYFLVDEASMVGREIWDVLQSYKRPIVAIGDPGQLEPPSRDDINLMVDPDIMLTEIHRQAAGSEIIQFATAVREGGHNYATTKLDRRRGEELVVTDKIETWNDESLDILICGLNRTRQRLNAKVRARQGRQDQLTQGEHVICLSNDPAFGVFNGLVGVVQESTKTRTRFLDWATAEVPVLWDGESKPRVMRLSTAFLGARALPDFDVGKAHRRKAVLVDYGYALTGHRSQGSQWERVGVINQPAPSLWDQGRWLYTTITRASKFLKVGR